MAKKRDVPKVVEAQAFVLSDAKGKCRAQLFVDDDFGPVLWLLDSNGRQRLSIGLDVAGRPVIQLIGKDQRPAFGIGADESDGSGFPIYQADGKPVLMVGTRPLDNTLNASVFDKKGKVVWRSSVVLESEAPASPAPVQTRKGKSVQP